VTFKVTRWERSDSAGFKWNPYSEMSHLKQAYAEKNGG